MKLAEAILIATLMLLGGGLFIGILLALLAFLVANTNIFIGLMTLALWLGLVSYCYTRV